MLIVLEHSDLVGSGLLGRTLRDHGHGLAVVRLHRGDPIPVDLDEADAIVTCGGESSAMDDSLEWLDAEMNYLREAHRTGRPIVAISLGSQILARALGGTLGRLEGGIEAGWHPLRLSPAGCEDPLLAGIAWTSIQPHWHREEVKTLPPGARLLASSGRCRHQAWAVGPWTYAFQYHPEIEADSMEWWAGADPVGLREAGLTLEQLRADTQKHYPACTRLAQRLFESVALLLMPVDRRYPGLVKDLHH
jgi:GMP synthase-like glutamine amidotransferase